MSQAKRDQNNVTTLIGVSSLDLTTPTLVAVDPVTGRMLVDIAGNTFYTDTVSGTINGSNVTFTVANTITTPLVLFLAGMPYQPTVDFTTSGTTITMTVAPDASLSGQPFWLLHT